MGKIIAEYLDKLDDPIFEGQTFGIFTRSIVDEYHRLVKLASGPELETKKIRISFLKKGKTNGKNH